MEPARKDDAETTAAPLPFEDGSQTLRIRDLAVDGPAHEPERTNCFRVFWIESGSGAFWTDAARHPFHADQLLFLVPYQSSRFVLREPLRAAAIAFHANFLCVETFHAETGCSGVLFNDPYGRPIVGMEGDARADVVSLIDRMRREQVEGRLAHREALLASMKLLLIAAARVKSPGDETGGPRAVDFRHPALGPLRDLIEANYRTSHAPSDYAAWLHMSPKTLGRIVRKHLGKTLTDLIRERILTHAKWQLLHTLRPVKAIAAELGFEDELYFSRLFRKATGISPTFFRDFETEIRGGSNLSMPSSHASLFIPPETSEDREGPSMDGVDVETV